MQKIRIRNKITLDAEFWAELSVVLFFSWRLIQIGLNFFLGSGTLSLVISLLVIYVPYFLACVMNPRKYFKLDFWILYIIILLFFLFTYLTHPEYAYYYCRETYGVWDHVLVPYRGIYAYLFIRLLDDPDRIVSSLKKAGWLMFIYFIYWYILSLSRGYWYGVVGEDASAEMSYSVSFGYTLLPYALLFLYEAITKKKGSDIFAAGLSIFLLLTGGSRGPLIFIGVFIVLYVLIYLQQTKYKTIKIVGIVTATAAIYAIYPIVTNWLMDLLNSFNFQSRFLTTLLGGTFSNDSGRLIIWEAAIKMIREQPFGYGAMGSRHVITNYIVAGYPHSIILELLIDFGVVVGGLLIVILVYQSIRMLFFTVNDGWKGLFLVFFSSACSLLISMTFWSAPTIWACLGLIVSKRIASRKKKIRLI